jgi:hypothetical protein
MSDPAEPSIKPLWNCFQGVIPSLLATADGDGVPNVTYLSQVFYVDERHVALSRQFFNKTKRNLDLNPLAFCELYEPVTMQAWRLQLRFLRSETEGPVFDRLSARIDAIAAHTGMSDIFRLVAADVCEVLAVERVDGYLSRDGSEEELPGVTAAGFRTELRGLQLISEQVNRATDLDDLLEAVLETLDEYFSFRHTTILFHDENQARLVTIASRGFGESGIGAEVSVGQGVIGKAVVTRGVFRLAGIDSELRYGRAVRREVISEGGEGRLRPEIPLPGLPDAQSMLVLPLFAGDRLVGALTAESRIGMMFDEWDEAYLEIVGNQIGLALDRLMHEAGQSDEGDLVVEPASLPEPTRARRKVSLVYYRHDDCIFVEGAYLIRNIPGRILWTLLRAWRDEGRTEFTNRELRLDRSLGLPDYRDNLESRLILLRKRLEENDAGVRMERTGRGRFRLVMDAEIEMAEK